MKNLLCGVVIVVASFLTILISPPAAMADTLGLCYEADDNLVSNCGFETSTVMPPVGWTLSNSLTGFDHIGPPANSGSNSYTFAQFSGGPASVISQSIPTTPGTNYIFSFFLSGGPDPTFGGTSLFTASVGGVQLLSLAATPGCSTALICAFTLYSFSVTGTGTSELISFSSINDFNAFSLDDVCFATGDACKFPERVPEPSSLMLLGAAGLLGLTCKKMLA